MVKSFNNVIEERYSVRSFQDKAVEKDLINQILECGRIAPTAGCENPVIVYSLDKEQIIKLKEATKYTFKANNMLVVCYDNKISYKREQDGLDFGIEDASIITTYMMLKITELGLGSCWVGSFYPDKVSSILNLPDNIIPVSLLPFGYIASDSKPSEWHSDRRTMKDFMKN
ncbi:MAG TPA: nitroreductase family protein [Bacilli bacterium]|nr:nitroreductase family protein [Bacilli bacterium]